MGTDEVYFAGQGGPTIHSGKPRGLLPPDPIEELYDEFSSAVIELEVDRAVAIVRELGADMRDSALHFVFVARSCSSSQRCRAR